VPRGYLPIEGLAAYDAAVQKLLFGAGSPLIGSGRLVTAQALGGTGALKIGADFPQADQSDAQVLISEPSWENHRALFEGAGFKVASYPYYDAPSHGLNFAGMCAALRAAPAGTIIALHACCHNPTGVDMSHEQWREVAQICKAQGLVPMMDIAYRASAKASRPTRRRCGCSRTKACRSSSPVHSPSRFRSTGSGSAR